MGAGNRNRKEWILNIAVNRWQFNRPKYVGKVLEEIRKCQPKRLEDWIVYYKYNVKPERYLEMKKHIQGEFSIDDYLDYLGMEIHKKISEVIKKEVEEISEEDCIKYIRELIFNRTFEGFLNEKNTVYGILEKELEVRLLPASAEWDGKYNIDFYIECKSGIIGIQIKPITYKQTPQIHNWRAWLETSHKRFQEEQNGRVFTIFSVRGEKGHKYIHDMEETLASIRKAIEELGCKDAPHKQQTE